MFLLSYLYIYSLSYFLIKVFIKVVVFPAAQFVAEIWLLTSVDANLHDTIMFNIFHHLNLFLNILEAPKVKFTPRDNLKWRHSIFHT